ncbi:MAG: ABC transporter ATP-binding protein [bacterium]
MLLRINQLHKSFGGLMAVKDFNLEVKQGEILSIIGPNGAGKTTIFNLISGFYTPDNGEIIFENQNICGLAPFIIAAKGISRTFQNIRLFEGLTVMDNIRIAFHFQRNYKLHDTVIHNKKYREQEKHIAEFSLYLLKVFQMEDRKGELAGNLPYGQQRQLEIIRALATGARLLLLDEPTAGMNHSEQEEAIKLIRRIRDEFHLTILLIEHQMNVVMNISERIVVMNFGEIIAMGSPYEIQHNSKVIEAYLGETPMSLRLTKSYGEMSSKKLSFFKNIFLDLYP